ncbi:hypothetical protein C8Q74DRAFT_97069 [Fomes fomentarius]|nr:hypothetical protein C8Q74DRAFT_97069 [Fomes fomentarius]
MSDSYVDDTLRRTPFNILSSCITTLALRTWSALHVDVTQGKSKYRRLLGKCGWLVFALLAPEVMLLIAYNQYHAAFRLTQDARQHLDNVAPEISWIKRISQCFRSPQCDRLPTQAGVSSQEGASFKHASPDGAGIDGESPEKEGSPSPDLEAQVNELEDSSNATLGDAAAPGQRKPRRKHPWTPTHSFYAVMGGFVLQHPHELPSPENRYLPKWQDNGVLTSEGVRLLMQNAPELIPDIHLDELLDRNKADGVAKVISVWQLLWFLLTCINRVGYDLPLTLLEISTIAHALCTLFTYIYWWDKPKDVTLPTVIKGDMEIGAWMSTTSGAQRCLVGGIFALSLDPEYTFLDPPNADLIIYPTTSAGPTIDVADFVRRDDFRHQTLARPSYKSWKMKFVFGDSLPWYHRYITGSTSCEEELERKEGLGRGEELGPEEELERERTSRRLSLAMEARKRYPKLQVPSNQRRTPPFVVSTAQLQASTAPGNIAPPTAVLLIAGWPHFLGFSEKITSSLEDTQALWKLATALMIGSAIVVVVLLGKVYQKDSDVPLKGALLAVTIVHFSSRIVLIEESFRQLAVLTMESPAFERQPSWEDYWPHFY